MGQWDSIKSSDVRKAINNALQGNDNRLTHSDIVDIVRATIMDGQVTRSELDDLRTVALESTTIEDRSKLMLLYLTQHYSSDLAFSFPRAGQRVAADRLCDFMKRSGRPHFRKLDRDKVGIDIMMRVARPGLISQRPAPLCGPVSFLYSLALGTPLDYAQFAIDLYENGRASVGDLEVEPRYGLRYYTSPPFLTSHGDWLTAASLRDSENLILSFYDEDQDYAGGTSVSEFVRWLKNAGFVNVDSEELNSYINFNSEESDLVIKDRTIIDRINRHFDNGYMVVLIVNTKVLNAEKQSDLSDRPDHFVVLRSRIVSTPASIRLTVYTHGNDDFQIPQGGPLKPGGFLRHLYGYVIAKPY